VVHAHYIWVLLSSARQCEVHPYLASITRRSIYPAEGDRKPDIATLCHSQYGAEEKNGKSK
jgi:hypothetical protein